VSDRIRAGIVGAGFMGTIHARAIRRAGGTVSRVASTSPESSRAGAERIGAESAADSVEELIAADDLDVIHVCTPNVTHAPLVRAAIAAGKHVVCEKPLAVDVAEAEDLAGLASAAGVTATVPFVYRFYPTVREARARVADGSAGPLRLHSPTSECTGVIWSSSYPATASPGSLRAPSWRSRSGAAVR